MDYKVVSQQVVDNDQNGLENIEGATHCVTRLRLVLKDTSKYNKAELENIDDVKGVLYNSGQPHDHLRYRYRQQGLRRVYGSDGR